MIAITMSNKDDFFAGLSSMPWNSGRRVPGRVTDIQSNDIVIAHCESST